MSLSLDDVRELAARAVGLTGADQAEALVAAGRSGLTRFADNRIHQNVTEDDAQVSVRAVVGRRTGVASTNRLDAESLDACCTAAVAAARLAPEDPDFPGLPSPLPIEYRERAREATRTFGPEARARAVAEIVGVSTQHGLVAAGTVSVSDSRVAIANSLGMDAAQEVTEISATVLATGASGGSGWASFTGMDAGIFSPAALGETAVRTAVRSGAPATLEPGRYAVVLAPEAVNELLFMLAYAGFSAKAIAEGSSFMTGRLGEKVLSERVTIVDDALAPHAMGLTFDYEGVPKRRVPLIEKGVAVQAVTDSYWAARTGAENTGHALPAPNSLGPLPLNIEMTAGETAEEEMVTSVEHGVYVNRFHYVNIEDPVRALLTGMTRDGTFLIEEGRIGAPVKNLRFTQSAVEALSDVLAVGRDRRHVGERGGASYVPSLHLGGFAFTGQTR